MPGGTEVEQVLALDEYAPGRPGSRAPRPGRVPPAARGGLPSSPRRPACRTARRWPSGSVRAARARTAPARRWATTTRCRRTGWGGRVPRARSRRVRDARVGEDQAQARVARADLHRVAPERRMPRPAWQRIGSRCSSASANTSCSAGWSSVKPSARGWSLMPRAPLSRQRRASSSGDSMGPAGRTRTAGRRCGGLGSDHVVGGRVAVRLVHREHERAGVEVLQVVDQLGPGAAEPVRVVDPDVRVHVEDVGQGTSAHALVPGQETGIRHHRRPA